MLSLLLVDSSQPLGTLESAASSLLEKCVSEYLCANDCQVLLVLLLAYADVFDVEIKFLGHCNFGIHTIVTEAIISIHS